jgi:hypothetical protein
MDFVFLDLVQGMNTLNDKGFSVKVQSTTGKAEQ